MAALHMYVRMFVLFSSQPAVQSKQALFPSTSSCFLCMAKGERDLTGKTHAAAAVAAEHNR